MFCVFSCLLSINGFIANEIKEGLNAGISILIIIILIAGIALGGLLGRLMTSRCSDIFICLMNAFVLSMVIYSFLSSFTSGWIVLICSFIFFAIICIILPFHFEQQMRI